MGATTFSVTFPGKTAKEAFAAARTDAQYQHGHGGYSGTIAEKNDFVMIKLPDGVDPRAYANQLIECQDERIDDKWGPAGCIALPNGKFLFFGWASE